MATAFYVTRCGNELARRCHKWRHLRMLIALFASYACDAQSASSGRPPWLVEPYLRPAFYGKVYDSVTRKSIPLVPMTITTQVGISASDSLGWYLRFEAPVGRDTVQFYCPTERRLKGRLFATRVVNVTPGMDSVVDFFVPFNGCHEPPVHTWRGEFRGHFTTGFETSDFEPCEPFEDLRGTAYEGLTVTAWVGPIDVPMRWPKVKSGSESRVFVRWRGTVTGPGSFGHLGVAEYELRVNEVLDVRVPDAGDCR